MYDVECRRDFQGAAVRLSSHPKITGQLKLSADAAVNFKARLYGWKMIESVINQNGILIDANAPVDRTYCNCTMGNATSAGSLGGKGSNDG